VTVAVTFGAAVHKLHAELRIRIRGALLPQVKTLLSFGASLSVIYVFTQVIFNSGAVVIAAFLPIEAVTFYAIAGNLSAQASGVGAALSNVMTPRVSALTSMGSNRVGEEILGVARMATLTSAPIAVTFWIRGESFITLWMGAEYGPTSGEVLRILAIVLWLAAWRSVAIQSLVGMARQCTLVPGFAVEAACNLALSGILVRPLEIVGVALGTLIPSVLMNLAFIPRCLSKPTRVPISLFYSKATLLPTLACIAFGSR